MTEFPFLPPKQDHWQDLFMGALYALQDLLNLPDYPGVTQKQINSQLVSKLACRNLSDV